MSLLRKSTKVGGDAPEPVPVGTTGSTGMREAHRVLELESRIADLESQLSALRQKVDAIPDHGAGLAGHNEWLIQLERWVRSCVSTLTNLGAHPLDEDQSGAADRVRATLMARLEVSTVMDWIATMAEVPEDLLVSVTVATRNRPELLRQAISSVLSQTYQRLELVVMDDSDSDETQQLLATIEDPRLRVVRTPARKGPGAAFNAGLDAATGDIIAFLDDDNVMHSQWLRSVVWAFTAFEDVDALYGAYVIEDGAAERGARSYMLPTLAFTRYDRARLERTNFVDRNTIAIRSSLKDVRYDEKLTGAEDWEHALRVFERAEPMALPAIACYYRTLVPSRVSDIADVSDSVRLILERREQG